MDHSPDEISVPPTGVLDRGLLLLQLFTMERNRLFLRDLAELSQLDKATTLRALKSLVQWGFLEKHADGSYSPGPANLRLAAIFKVTFSLTARIESPLDTIAERTGHSASFFVRVDQSRVCLGRSRKKAVYDYYIDVGTSVPLAHGGSAARVLTAYTAPPRDTSGAEVRSAGFALSRGERLRHFASISLPVSELDGSFLGTLTVAGPAAEVSEADLHGYAAIVQTELARAGFATSPSAAR